jgi:hypothetical protein
MITDFLKRRPLIAYLTLVFATSWGGALLGIGRAGGMAGTHAGE